MSSSKDKKDSRIILLLGLVLILLFFLVFFSSMLLGYVAFNLLANPEIGDLTTEAFSNDTNVISNFGHILFGNNSSTNSSANSSTNSSLNDSNESDSKTVIDKEKLNELTEAAKTGAIEPFSFLINENISYKEGEGYIENIHWYVKKTHEIIYEIFPEYDIKVEYIKKQNDTENNSKTLIKNETDDLLLIYLLYNDDEDEYSSEYLIYTTWNDKTIESIKYENGTAVTEKFYTFEN